MPNRISAIAVQDRGEALERLDPHDMSTLLFLLERDARELDAELAAHLIGVARMALETATLSAPSGVAEEPAQAP